MGSDARAQSVKEQAEDLGRDAQEFYECIKEMIGNGCSAVEVMQESQEMRDAFIYAVTDMQEVLNGDHD